jgi:hypothetical protein
MVSDSSTSVRTGTPPTAITADIEAMNVYPGTRTSSPGRIPAAVKAAINALVPEFTATQYCVPILSENSASKQKTLPLKRGLSSLP